MVIHHLKITYLNNHTTVHGIRSHFIYQSKTCIKSKNRPYGVNKFKALCEKSPLENKAAFQEWSSYNNEKNCVEYKLGTNRISWRP